jgi:hypothetical protein
MVLSLDHVTWRLLSVYSHITQISNVMSHSNTSDIEESMTILMLGLTMEALLFEIDDHRCLPLTRPFPGVQIIE